MTSLLVGARRPIRFIAFPRTNQQPAILKRLGNCRYNEAEILTWKCRRELINYPPCLYGSKRTDYVGFGVVMEDKMRGYRLDNCCSIFSVEAIALYRALQLNDPKTPRKYCIYTDSMNVLEAIENYNDRCHPVVCDIIDITSRLHGKGCDMQFSWIPSRMGITGNERADIVTRSATTELPLTVPLCDMKRVIQHHIDNARQELWDLQTNNKLHCPVIKALPVMLMLS
ncbi:RNase H domain-containing protein [Trichonephila clavipes]|nr:RNase H domain-containing protein [Trichonephila clavipes]